MGGNAEVDQWSVQVWYDDDGDDDDIDDDDGDGVDDDDDDDDQWSVISARVKWKPTRKTFSGHSSGWIVFARHWHEHILIKIKLVEYSSFVESFSIALITGSLK